MIASFLITFRETLEAALIIGIIWGYLVRTSNRQFLATIVHGSLAGIAASIGGAFLFQRFAGGFEGRAEQIFEGATMILAGILLSSMILWMLFKNSAHQLEGEVAAAVSNNTTNKTALFFLVFVSILREGIETVLFLSSARIMSSANFTTGALLGLLLASGLGWSFFKGAVKCNLKTLFTFSSLLLILFAAGLFAHGVHEFQEAGILPVMIEHVWDVNPALTNGGYPALHEKGSIGSFLKGLFGYNGDPTLLEVLTYILSLATASIVWRMARKMRQQDRSATTA